MNFKLVFLLFIYILQSNANAENILNIKKSIKLVDKFCPQSSKVVFEEIRSGLVPSLKLGIKCGKHITVVKENYQEFHFVGVMVDDKLYDIFGTINRSLNDPETISYNYIYDKYFARAENGWFNRKLKRTIKQDKKLEKRIDHYLKLRVTE